MYGSLKLGGRRKSGASVKTLKKILKKAGLKVSGKKATLTRRAKKAHLKMRGGETPGASGIPAAPGTPPASAASSGTPPASAASSGSMGSPTSSTPAMGGRRSRSRGRSMRGFPRLY